MTTPLEHKLAAALNLIVLDCIQGADPVSKECREITGSYDKAQEALAAYDEQVKREQIPTVY